MFDFVLSSRARGVQGVPCSPTVAQECFEQHGTDQDVIDQKPVRVVVDRCSVKVAWGRGGVEKTSPLEENVVLMFSSSIKSNAFRGYLKIETRPQS